MGETVTDLARTGITPEQLQGIDYPDEDLEILIKIAGDKGIPLPVRQALTRLSYYQLAAQNAEVKNRPLYEMLAQSAEELLNTSKWVNGLTYGLLLLVADSFNTRMPDQQPVN